MRYLSCCLAVSACLSLSSALPACAADETAPVAPAAAAPAVVFNATLASQYVSRGFRQTWGRPALQAGADYAHASGWSVGTWLSSISGRFVENGTLEWDLYGGYGGTAGEFGYSALVYYYAYPGAEYTATATTYNYGEVALGLSYKMLYAKYLHTYTPEFFGITNARGTGYLDIGANVDLGGGHTLILHAGNGRVAGTGNEIWNWRDAKLGISKAWSGGWTATAAYTRAWGKTDVYENYTLGIPNSAGVIESSDLGKGTLVVSLTRTF
jgi:uncharacterized protein (TIGR02001 family)